MLFALISSRTPSTGRWAVVVRRCLVCCGIAILGVGSLEAQQRPIMKKFTSPPVDPNAVSRMRLQARAAAAGATPLALVVPLTNTFTLHSHPTATKTIYLDFDGHSTTGTAWNSGGNTIVTAPFSLDSNPSFSNAELTMIQEIWQRIAECYSPFDVDVTTQTPPLTDLINAGSGDTRWGIRVLIGASTPSPAPGAGGVAYVGSFSWNSDTPCFVFPASLANFGKYIAAGSVHEVGHTVGLSHDGRISPPEEYYAGQGSGLTGWAPHMGVGYYQNLVQWSKGEYTSANNMEDDLTIITTQNGFGYRPDDFGSSLAAASKVGGAAGTGTAAGVFTVKQSGLIEQRTDTDWFKLTTGTGQLDLTAVGGQANTMLDIQMDLYSNSGSLLVSSNPAAELNASISRSVSAGTYYLKIDGVGNGNPLVTGYTDYSSLGQYSIAGSFPSAPVFIASNVTAVYSAPDKKLTLTGDATGNSVSVYYQAGSLKVEGANGTKVNGVASFSASHSGQLVLEADFKEGDDAFSMIGVPSSTTTILLGAGADKASFTLCHIQTLNLDGGPGIDAFTTTSSTVGTINPLNVP